MFWRSNFYAALKRRFIRESRAQPLSIYHEKFDPKWYCESLRLNGYTEREFLESELDHYLRFGWRAGISPAPGFDPRWYLEQYPDVAIAGVEPFRHFLEYGYKEGRVGDPKNVKEAFLWSSRSEDASGPRDFNSLSKHPLISVLVTNKDGISHLPDLFDSLDNQTYKKFEVIFVDDASSDTSAEYAASRGALVIKNNESLGFASGNNLAYEQASGELVALINNDMRLDPNFFEASAKAISIDMSVGAISPKIRFWSSFQTITISSAQTFELDLDALHRSQVYKKHFVRIGTRSQNVLVASDCGSEYMLALDLPIQKNTTNIIISANILQSFNITMPGFRKSLRADTGIINFDVHFNKSQKENFFFIINNVGGVNFSKLNPTDRGFGERDFGQYDSPCDVEYFCGGAVLIRRDALLGDKLFIDDFVAYYEDSELSSRLVGRGYKIRYWPTAIVYHKHSASNVELSWFWRQQTFRNKILFQYMLSNEKEKADIIQNMRLEINHLIHWYGSVSGITNEELEFSKRLPAIQKEIEYISEKIDQGVFPEQTRPRIGVYNSFWDTRGGGEAHALDIAEVLCSFGSVELLCENDFEMDLLLSFFNKTRMKCRKRIVSVMTEDVTAEYDFFVNARYQSQIPSLARFSFYIVSFPSKDAPLRFLQSYRFLFNSHYTQEWAYKYWGNNFDGAVVYPRVADDFYSVRKDLVKKKQILSVGRFTSSGHIKNQLEIVSAFKILAQKRPDLLKEWELILVGSSNHNEYLEAVHREADGIPVHICVDAEFADVVSSYESAAIYIHASGFSRDPLSEPEKFEHFGMAVAQATASGCFPIVYAAAGPLEIVSLLGFGSLFSTLSELVGEIERAIEGFEIHSEADQCLQRANAAQVFSHHAQKDLVVKQLEKFINTT